ncbi:MAG: Holliday junction resolvase Hjc [Candidatus Woesearchaeota archaeon]|jgi:Holliday junction resolvase
MSRKSKGISYERELIHLFWKTREWAAIRIAGSGNTQYPSADVIAGNATRKLAIECKSSKSNSIYISKEDVQTFQEFAKKFGAEPWIAVRFNKTPWHFISMDNLVLTENSVVITIENIKYKGLLFEEILGKFTSSSTDNSI